MFGFSLCFVNGSSSIKIYQMHTKNVTSKKQRCGNSKNTVKYTLNCLEKKDIYMKENNTTHWHTIMTSQALILFRAFQKCCKVKALLSQNCVLFAEERYSKLRIVMEKTAPLSNVYCYYKIYIFLSKATTQKQYRKIHTNCVKVIVLLLFSRHFVMREQ